MTSNFQFFNSISNQIFTSRNYLWKNKFSILHVKNPKILTTSVTNILQISRNSLKACFCIIFGISMPSRKLKSRQHSPCQVVMSPPQHCLTSPPSFQKRLQFLSLRHKEIYFRMADAKSIKTVWNCGRGIRKRSRRREKKLFSMHKLWRVLMNKEVSNLNFSRLNLRMEIEG